MALNASILNQGFLDLFSRAGSRDYPRDPKESADRFASTYARYARTALAGPNRPIFSGAEEAKLSSILFPAMIAPRSGTPRNLARAWQSGIASFWLTPPIVFSGANPGVVTTIPGISSVTPCLIAVFSNRDNSSREAARGLTRCLDAVTKTIIYFSAVPPPSGFTVTLT